MQTAVCAIFFSNTLCRFNIVFLYVNENYFLCPFFCSTNQGDWFCEQRARVSLVFCGKHSLNYVNNEHHKFILMKCVHEQFQAHLVLYFGIRSTHNCCQKGGEIATEENPWSTNDRNELEFFSVFVCVYIWFFVIFFYHLLIFIPFDLLSRMHINLFLFVSLLLLLILLYLHFYWLTRNASNCDDFSFLLIIHEAKRIIHLPWLSVYHVLPSLFYRPIFITSIINKIGDIRWFTTRPICDSR